MCSIYTQTFRLCSSWLSQRCPMPMQIFFKNPPSLKNVPSMDKNQLWSCDRFGGLAWTNNPFGEQGYFSLCTCQLSRHKQHPQQQRRQMKKKNAAISEHLKIQGQLSIVFLHNHPRGLLHRLRSDTTHGRNVLACAFWRESVSELSWSQKPHHIDNGWRKRWPESRNANRQRQKIMGRVPSLKQHLKRCHPKRKLIFQPPINTRKKGNLTVLLQITLWCLFLQFSKCWANACQYVWFCAGRVSAEFFEKAW